MIKKNDNKTDKEKSDYRKLLYDRLEEYVNGVNKKKIVACKSIQKSVKRYLKDLKNKKYYINYAEVDKFFDFCFYVFIESDKNKYVRFDPLSWMVFYFFNLYAFYYTSEPDKRRFNRSFLTVSRKNAKTTIADIQALYAVTKENDNARVYLVSQSKNTATDSALFIAKKIIENSPALNKRLRCRQYSIEYTNKKSTSTFKMLPCKAETMNALKPTFAIVDELHLMPTSAIIDKLTSGMGSSSNALLSIISTRGNNSTYYQYELEQAYRKVLDGESKDETTFIMMFEQDDESEVNNPDMWIKSNPSMGTTLKKDYLVDCLNKAKLTPTSLKEFFSFSLNQWVESKEKQFIEQEFINAAFKKGEEIKLNFDFFKDKDVYLGVDLSKTDDLSSLVMLTYDEELKQFYAYPFIYLAKNPINRIRNRGIDLTQWIFSGEIHQCENNRIDYKDILNDILKINEDCNIINLGYDSYLKSEIIPALDFYRISNQFVSQSMKDITTATKLLDRIFAQNEITCTNNAFKWQFKNCVVYPDINFNVKLAKNISLDSIDSCAALVNALELWRIDNEDKEYKVDFQPISISF